MRNATGSTQSVAIAIRQSKKNSPTATSVVEIQEAISSGIQCEDPV